MRSGGTSGRGRCARAGIGAVVVASILAVAGPGAPASAAPVAAGDETLRLVRIDEAPAGAVVDVLVPFSLAGRTLPLSAFQVSLGDAPVTVTADRLTDQPIVLDLVVETPTDPTARATLQGALVEFLEQLEPGVRLRIADGGELIDVGQDRAAALERIRDLSPSTAGTTSSALAQVLGQDLPRDSAPSGVARVVVVAATGAPASLLAGVPEAEDLLAAGDLAPTVRGRFRAVIDARPEVVLAPADGATSTTANTTGPQLAAFDAIARDLRSTYRLTVPGATPGQRISVQMSTAAGPTRVTGTVATGAGTPAPTDGSALPTTAVPPAAVPPSAAAAPSVTEPATSAAPSPVSEAEQVEPSGGTPWWVLVIVGIAALALAVAAIRLLVRRSARRGDGAGVAAEAELLPPVLATVAEPDAAEKVAAAPVVPAAVEPVEPVAPAAVETVSAVGTPPPFDPTAMVAFAPDDRPGVEPEPAPMFSAESESEAPVEAPLLFESSEDGPPPVPAVFSTTLNVTSDPRIVRAADRAEHALAALRAALDDRHGPAPRALTIAIEAAASGWLENREITADEVVHLLDGDRRHADPISVAYADGLRDLLEGPDRTVWDLALVLAERLGHTPVGRASDHYGPSAGAGSLAEQVAAVIAIDDSEFVGRLGGIVSRGLLASWPSRSGRLDQVALIVSPSLAAAAEALDSAGVNHAELIIGLLAVMEDAALRMMRSEQRVAELRQHYLDRVDLLHLDDATHANAKFAGKESRWVLESPAETDGIRRHLVELIMASPVVSSPSVAAELGISLRRANAEIEGLVRRGWLRPIDDGGNRRWVAHEVLDSATRPFALDFSPIDPSHIDLTVAAPRSVHHAHS